jgi:hypothetical protein
LVSTPTRTAFGGGENLAPPDRSAGAARATPGETAILRATERQTAVLGKIAEALDRASKAPPLDLRAKRMV